MSDASDQPVGGVEVVAVPSASIAATSKFPAEGFGLSAPVFHAVPAAGVADPVDSTTVGVVTPVNDRPTTIGSLEVAPTVTVHDVAAAKPDGACALNSAQLSDPLFVFLSCAHVRPPHANVTVVAPAEHQ
jgi:hypothetical protein